MTPVARAARPGDGRRGHGVLVEPPLRPGAGPRRPGRVPRPRAGPRARRPADRGRGGRAARRARPGGARAGLGSVRLRPRRRGHPHRRSSAGSPRSPATSGPSCTPAGAGTTRWPPTSGSTPSASCAAVASRDHRPPGGPAGPGPGSRATPTSPATPTCSGPNRCSWPIICWPTAGRCPGTSTGCWPPWTGSTSPRSGPGPWPVRRSPSTPTAWPPTSVSEPGSRTRSTPCPTATSWPRPSSTSPSLGVHLSRIGEELVLWSDRGVRLRRARRRLRHRQLDAPPEEEPRRGRAGPGQVRPAHRQPDRAAGHPEGPPPLLQPRPAGGQGAAVRLGDPDPPGPGRAVRPAGHGHLR